MFARQTMAELLNSLPQTGSLVWIGLRPKRRADMLEPDEAELDCSLGLIDDRYAGRSQTRQVTLIQHEHIAAISSMLCREVSLPELRRNLAVNGINLLALKNKKFRIGNAILEGTGLCHPCSRMEEIFGAGGYNAVRGHGGITARVITGGRITCGDSVSLHT